MHVMVVIPYAPLCVVCVCVPNTIIEVKYKVIFVSRSRSLLMVYKYSMHVYIDITVVYCRNDDYDDTTTNTCAHIHQKVWSYFSAYVFESKDGKYVLLQYGILCHIHIRVCIVYRYQSHSQWEIIDPFPSYLNHKDIIFPIFPFYFKTTLWWYKSSKETNIKKIHELYCRHVYHHQ